MSDVIQKVIIRIGATETASSVVTRVLQHGRRALAAAETSLADYSRKASASAAASAASFTQGKGDLAASVRATVDKAKAEIAKLSANKDVQLGVEIGREKLDEARIKVSQFLERNSRGLRFRWAVAVEFKDEVIDEARRSLQSKLARVRTAIQVPIGIARERLNAGLAEADARIDRWKRENATVRIAFALAASAGAVLASATAVLGPLRRMAAAGVQVVFSGTASKLASAAQTALGSVVSVGKGALAAVSVVASSIGIIVGAGVAAVGLVIGAVVGLRAAVGQAIEDNGNLADRLGATTEGLMSLQHAARTNGSSADAMNGALQRMTRSLGDAISGSKEARANFSQLGLSADDLAKMDADKSFETIATRIAALPTAAQRASAAVGIFGKESQSLLPLLSQGAAGIAKARAEAERMGLTLSRIDVAKVAAANAAMDALANQVKGYLTQAAVAIAPYVQGIADQLLSLMPTGQQMGDTLVNVMESIARAVGYVADYVNLFIAGWHALNAAVIAVAGGIIKSIDLIGSGITKLINLLPGVEVEWTDTFSSMADSMAEDVIAASDKAAEAYGKFARGDASAAVGKFFDEARVKAQANAETIARNAEVMREAQRAAGQLGDTTGQAADKAGKLAEEMARITGEAATAGLSDAQKEVKKLLELGATDVQLKIAVNAMGVKEDIDRVLGSIKNSGDDYWGAWERGLDVLDKLRAAGQITAEQFDTMRQKITESLEEKELAAADKIRDAIKSDADKSLEQIREAERLLASRAIDQPTFDAYLRSLQEKAQGSADNTKMQFASNDDAGMATGASESLKQQLSLMSPVKSIASDTRKIVTFFENAARRQNAGGGGHTNLQAFGLP